MRHTISAMDLRKSIGDILDHVRLRNDTYIVERRGKPMVVILNTESETEYQILIKEKIEILEAKIKKNIALTENEFGFLNKHANYPSHQKSIFCNQEIMDTLSDFGGAYGVKELKPDTISNWIKESEHKT